MARQKKRRMLLRTLNLFGLDHLDPVILAALADERPPLLLIRAHGTGKSDLLNRIAAALALEHWHYNASPLSFDDLLGYPVPDGAGDGLRYLRTPGDLWDAGSVFLDEISRCRPESQNKLFSVIHERRVQGLALSRLRFRWAAMNPPPVDGQDLDEPVYAGSLPLDPALADRYPYVIEVPALGDLRPAVRRELITRGGEPPAGKGGWSRLAARTRAAIAATSAAGSPRAVAFVDTLVAPLIEAGFMVSGWRAVMLAASVTAIHAAGHRWGPLPEDLRIEAALCGGCFEPGEAELRHLADDQALCVGYANDRTETGHLPPAHWLARRIGRELHRLRAERGAGEVGPDGKVAVRLRVGRGAWNHEHVSVSLNHHEGSDWLDLLRIAEEAVETAGAAAGTTDTGATVAAAPRELGRAGEPSCGSTDPRRGGNGSAMRRAPMNFAGKPKEIQ